MADITTWTPITAPTDFQDDAVFDIDFRTKTVQVLVEQPIVAGENLSQFIKFQAPRFYDNIDLAEMSVNILYVSPSGNKGISAAVNTEYSDDMIRWGWLVPYAACPEKGTLLFVLEFVGADYTLKTTIASTPVLDSINDADVIPEPVEQTWYITLQANVSAALQEAQTALGRIESIFNALGTPMSAGTAVDMVDESAIYVYTGSETGYTYGNWYYYDGTEWVSGGAYASTALVTDPTLSQSGQAADAKVVGDALASLDAELIVLRTFSNTGTDKAVWATNAVNLSADSDYYFCLISYAGVNTEGLQYIVDVRNVYTTGSQLSTKIATAGELVKIKLDASRTYTRTNIAFNRSAETPSSSTASSWTYAIFKGIPNRSRIANTLRNVALYGISEYTWENIAYYPSGAGWATTPDRISVRNIYPAQNLDVRAKDGYVFTVNYFDGNGNYLSRALNVTHHTISADSRAGLTVYYADNSAIAPEDAQNAVILTYVAGEFGEHKYSGDKIDLKRHSISMEQIAFTVPNRVENYGVMQAGDMFGGTYAQAYGNYLQLYDFTAGTLSAEYPMNGGHANSMAFSDDYYAPTDNYPLLYVGAYDSPTVYVNRITTNGVSLVDTLVFSASQTGYCTNVAIDPINKHLYMLGYSVNDPSQVSGNNIIVSKWDLGTVTDNGDNTHSPTFVKSFALPIVTYMQDCKFHDGKIFVLCGIGSDYPTKVYVIDVTGERIANIIDSFTTAISNSEKESIVINENDDYMLIGGFNGFYKVHF